MPLRVRLVAALVALWCATGVLSLPATAAPTACRPGGTTEDIGGGWLVSRPTFPAGPRGITLLASPAFDPNLLYATNGTVLLRSVDAGCGWATVFSAASAQGIVPSSVAITALSAPSSATNSKTVYVGLTRTALAEVTTPAIAVSTDRGSTFAVRESAAGLPLTGSVTEVTANPQVPTVAYAVVRTGLLVTQGSLYATTDGGTSWAQRSAFAGFALVAHPTTPTTLFARSSGTVVRSTDCGTTFVPATPPGEVVALDGAPGGGGLRLAAATRGVRQVFTANGTGSTWVPQPAPVAPTSVAAAPLQRLLAAADDRALFLLAPNALDVTPVGGPPTALSVTAPTASGFAVTGLRGGTMLRLALDLRVTPVQPVGGLPVRLLPPGPVTQFPSLILPAGLRVRLPAGGRAVVPHRLLVPRTPTQIDVLFLIDSTGSMDRVISDLKTGISQIASALGRNGAGLDIRIGVGDFRDYPPPDGPGSSGDWPWRLRRPVLPITPALAQAIDQITTGGGTGDGYTSGWGALFRSTTGADLAEGRLVPVVGEQAGYRPGSLRLAMLASDAPAHEAGESYSGITEPGATPTQVTRALRAAGVHVVGLAVPNGSSGDPTPYLRDAADGSRSYAPRGGVDCDGSGSVDLQAGAPLVCPIAVSSSSTTVNVGGVGVQQGARTASGLTSAVIGLAAGIPDAHPVTVTVGAGAGFAHLRGATSPVLDLHADNEVPFDVELSCPVGPAASHTIELRGAARGRTLATSTLTLECGGVRAAVAAAVPPVVGQTAEVAAAPPPPAAQGQPLPNPNPNPPNPNVNPAANVNANPGVADQTEEQPQLAFAESDGGEQLAMSSLAFVVVAGLLTCTAGGLALRRRAAEQVAEV